MAQKKYVSLDKLGLYDTKIKGVITAGDEAAQAAALDAAKKYADGLATNYDAAGAAATAQSEAIKEAGNLVNALANGAVKGNTDAITAIKDGATIDSFADVEAALAGKQATGDYATKAEAQGYANAKDAAIQAAQAAADAAQADVDSLETLVGKLPEGTTAKDVVDYVNVKTAGIATDAALTELNNQVSGLQTTVQGIQEDYLTSEDKTELSNLITAEANRATGIEGGLRTDVDEIKADYLKSSDKEALQTQINTIMNNPDAEGAINSINEFTQYITEHGTIAEGFRTDIDKNKDDISAMDTAYKAADTAIKGRLDVLEAIDHDAYVAADTTLKNEIEGKINAKADASVVSAMDTAYKAADTELSGKITALENKFGTGEGSVSDMISDAIDAERAEIDVELDKKVDKVDGYGLSKNDLSDALKANYDAAYEHSQVAHAPANAQANVIESVKVNGSALTITDKAVDIAVPTDNSQLANGAGYLVANDIANKADKATTLAGYGIADAYTKSEVDTAVANAVGQFVECSESEINALFA